MSARDLLHDMLAAGFALDVAAGKLLVTPASALTDDMRAELRACKPELIALLAGQVLADDDDHHHHVVVSRRCIDCQHLTRANTCGEPVAAGLLTGEEGFGIVWPPKGHGAACPAFTGRMPTEAADRPYKLTKDEADRCHAPCWHAGEIAAFTARTERFALLGRSDADDLAELLTLRDRDGDGDDRRLCLECTWLGDTGRCLAAAAGRIPGTDRRLEPAQALLQRCGSFGLRKGLV